MPRFIARPGQHAVDDELLPGQVVDGQSAAAQLVGRVARRA